MTNKELSKIYNECVKEVRDNSGNIFDLFEKRKNEFIKQKERGVEADLFSMEFFIQEFPTKCDKIPKKTKKKYMYSKNKKALELEQKTKIIEPKFYTKDEIFNILKPWRSHIYSDDKILTLSEKLAINLEKKDIKRKNVKGKKFDILTVVKPYKLYDIAKK